jgi:hypothetical protein
MSFFIFFILFVISALPALIVSLIAIPKRSSFYTGLYNEGLKNENAGHYQLALDNYEGALLEMLKFRSVQKLTKIINQRIRILRTTIEYEKNFNPVNHDHV